MGWAQGHIERLLEGETVQFRPRGHSMGGKVDDGNLVTVEPLTESTSFSKGDIVLCKVMGREYLHLIKAIGAADGSAQFLIGNNKGRTNGWVSRNKIYGKCVKVEK